MILREEQLMEVAEIVRKTCIDTDCPECLFNVSPRKGGVTCNFMVQIGVEPYTWDLFEID